MPLTEEQYYIARSIIENAKTLYNVDISHIAEKDLLQFLESGVLSKYHDTTKPFRILNENDRNYYYQVYKNVFKELLEIYPSPILH